MKTVLMEALCHRRDRIALNILREHPDLAEEEIIGAALDNGCVRVIRYLREHGLITLRGSEEREEIRRKKRRELLDALDVALPEIEDFFNGNS